MPRLDSSLRLVQAVPGTTEQGQGPAAVVEGVVEAAHADMEQCLLHEDLPAQLPRRTCRGELELGQRRLGMSVL